MWRVQTIDDTFWFALGEGRMLLAQLQWLELKSIRRTLVFCPIQYAALVSS